MLLRFMDGATEDVEGCSAPPLSPIALFGFGMPIAALGNRATGVHALSASQSIGCIRASATANAASEVG